MMVRGVPGGSGIESQEGWVHAGNCISQWCCKLPKVASLGYWKDSADMVISA